MRKLLLLGLMVVLASSAQAQRADSTRMLLKGGFEEVAGFITKAAELVPAERWNYRPVATVRTFGELVAHAADGYNWYCGNATKNTEWSDAVEKGRTDKATVMAKLKAAT